MYCVQIVVGTVWHGQYLRVSMQGFSILKNYSLEIIREFIYKYISNLLIEFTSYWKNYFTVLFQSAKIYHLIYSSTTVLWKMNKSRIDNQEEQKFFFLFFIFLLILLRLSTILQNLCQINYYKH